MHLTGKIAVVTGASRGIGRGIALQLGAAGATVYITGRNKPHDPDSLLPSLEDTARDVSKPDIVKELEIWEQTQLALDNFCITQKGGEGIAIYCDHSKPEEITQLFERIEREHNGKLDILVNNAYSAVEYLFKNIGKCFWEMDIEAWDEVNNVGLKNHYICSVLAARMMVKHKSGLIVNISSFGGLKYLFNVPYGVGKAAVDRMAADCAHELKNFNVACLSLWPGPVKTELVVNEMGKENHNDMLDLFQNGESTEFAGKCIVHLAQDINVMQKSGRVWLTADLADMYGFSDIDGTQPSNFRSVKFLVDQAAWHKTAGWIPSWIKLPGWMFALSTSKF
uniref:Dehydrogenase/reductase SDR family member 1 n=1 Tax=Romanomermis culicivorax TaxID=13658 RepID=A0A915JD01_ROMCU